MDHSEQQDLLYLLWNLKEAFQAYAYNIGEKMLLLSLSYNQILELRAAQ